MRSSVRRKRRRLPVALNDADRIDPVAPLRKITSYNLDTVGPNGPASRT
jgi:hypothetical protein